MQKRVKKKNENVEKKRKFVEFKEEECKKFRIVAKNIPQDATEIDLKKYFGKNCEIRKHLLDNKFKGTVFVQYKNYKDMYERLRNNEEFNNKKIKMSYCLPKDKYLQKQKEKNETENNNSVKYKNGNKNKNRIEYDSSSDSEVEKKKEKTYKTQKEEKTFKKQKEDKIVRDIEESSENNENTTNLDIYNLSYKTTKEEIKEYFEKYGKITNIKMFKNKNNFFTGICKIEFCDLKNIIFSKPLYFNQRLIEVFRKKEIKVGGESDTRVFLSNINKKLTKEDIRKTLKDYKIRNIDLRSDQRKDRNFGYCFIQFKNEDEAHEFIKSYDNYKILGEKCVAELAYDKYKNK
ncbi:RNA-binding domain protein [Spraguea lophii 42_110]|uniref:RNA-binding domain protein n=1 Tax=Spraguea lophii (strain 42_110) TaxID=1358809 RepID=S7W985_SPRLO|nr:RNA-binding domain protein [Spraguea lophii 42_110]